MARSESSLAVDAVVRQMAKTPALKESTRRGRWFIRAVSDVFHCVYVQSSQWNTPDEARFTVNLYVVWPRWEEVWTGRPFTGAHEAAPIAEVRLGFLVDGRDHWWTVRSRADAPTVAAEVSAVLEAHGPGFYGKFAGSQSVLATFDAGGALPVLFNREFIHATLLHSVGRREESAALISRQLAANPTWLGGRAVAARLDFRFS